MCLTCQVFLLCHVCCAGMRPGPAGWEATHGCSVLSACQMLCRSLPPLLLLPPSVPSSMSPLPSPLHMHVACCLLHAGCWMLDAGCWMLDVVRCMVHAAGHLSAPALLPPTPRPTTALLSRTRCHSPAHSQAGPTRRPATLPLRSPGKRASEQASKRGSTLASSQ